MAGFTLAEGRRRSQTVTFPSPVHCGSTGIRWFGPAKKILQQGKTIIVTGVASGIAFCSMTQYGRFVSMLKLDLSDYRIVQDTHFSLGGASGGTGKAGEADPIETHVHLETSVSDETAQEMLDVCEQTCFRHAFCWTDLKTRLKMSEYEQIVAWPASGG